MVVTPDPEPETGSQPPAPDPKPVAVVPSQVDALVSKTVTLDASKSIGVGNSTLSYLWSLESKPTASTAQLLYNTYSALSFYPDVEGSYRFKLVVSSGGQSSAPAYVDLEAVPLGKLAPFATFKASGFRVGDSGGVNACNYYRDAANDATFWSWRTNAYELNCVYPSVSTPADLTLNGIFSGGTLSYIAANFAHVQGAAISGKSLPVWADVYNLSGYGYTVSAEAIDLAKVPLGKSTGTVITHSMSPAYLQPWTTGTLQYKVEGQLQPVNVPAGWQVSQDVTVRVTLEGSTFENNTPGYATATLFEQTYTADFSETIPLNLNWAEQPIALAGTAAFIRSTVVHRMTLKRTTD